MTFSFLALQILLFAISIVYVNFVEWWFHKYVLHGLGKNPKSWWRFHWAEHHYHSRRNGFVDPDYQQSLSVWNAQSKEAFAMVLGAIAHLPLAWIAPGAWLGVMYGGLRYYIVHRKSHLNPEWAKKNIPWHYAHHMGPNQDSNWCVTRPWFDLLLGTAE
jgi:sterol desaturase/sphingolipid hydroxylase (fatty acid hydroxylase superfamily)